MKGMWNELKEMYERLGDEKSRYIFRKRLAYNLCNQDTQPIREIIKDYKDEEIQTVLTLIQRKDEYADREIIIFGAGRWGGFYHSMLQKYGFQKIIAFCDNRKAGSVYRQLRVLTVEEACKEYPDALFVISGAASRMEMHRQLCSLEIPRENIFLYLYTTRVFGIQYFDQDIIRNRSEGGVFIDGGALDLTDTKHFIEKNPGYEKVYAFEPDEENYRKCCEIKERNMPDFTGVEVVNRGLWSEETQLHFNSNQGSSCLTDQGETTVKVTSIDSFMQGREKVSFIKMDIEGAEMAALKGARKTISKDHPDLAICIYHKNEDILEIPRYILELNPDYTFYIRHYSCYTWETVLYAVSKEKIEK